MNFKILEEVDSTNSYVTRHAAGLPDMTMVIAERQTAGRGQRGNSWESEPGRNLTVTLFHRPENLEPRAQFALSEAVALAVADYLLAEGLEAAVKWPNDIYVGDRKICGILIEHSVMPGLIEHSRIGIGLNVNQARFVSDAPNPVSMFQLDGVRRDVSHVAAAVGAHLERRLRQAATPEGRAGLHEEFVRSLWRGDGRAYPFRRRSDALEFIGVIEGVSPEGPIRIRDSRTGEGRDYWFKEVEFLLTPPADSSVSPDNQEPS